VHDKRSETAEQKREIRKINCIYAFPYFVIKSTFIGT